MPLIKNNKTEILKIVRFRLVLILIIPVILIIGCSHTSHDDFIGDISFGGFTKQPPLSNRPTARELQERLMSFADRYLAKSSQVTENYLKAVKTRDAKEFALSTFVYPGLTASVRLSRTLPACLKSSPGNGKLG
jgi:hypothetical protein